MDELIKLVFQPIAGLIRFLRWATIILFFLGVALIEGWLTCNVSGDKVENDIKRLKAKVNENLALVWPVKSQNTVYDSNDYQAHVVQPGEDLTLIARYYRTSASTLRQVNKLERNQQVDIGRALMVPVVVKLE